MSNDNLDRYLESIIKGIDKLTDKFDGLSDEWNNFKVENARETLLNQQHRNNKELHPCKDQAKQAPASAPKKNGNGNPLLKYFTPKLVVGIWLPLATVAAVYTGEVLRIIGKMIGVLP